jgi:cell division protein FtsB
VKTEKKRDEYVIVRRRPGYRLRRTLVLLVFSVVSAAVGYLSGRAEGYFNFATVQETKAHLEKEWRSRREERSEEPTSGQRLASLERARSLDEQALREARDTISELETEIADLKTDLIFYRNIMAPSESTKGLQIDSMTLGQQRTSRIYDFKLVLTQMGGNKTYISGVVTVNVIGFRSDEKQAVPLRDLSRDIENLGVKFRFRYFQDVKGELILPEDFKPLEIQVIAEASGKKSVKIERTFDWARLTEK